MTQENQTIFKKQLFLFTPHQYENSEQGLLYTVAVRVPIILIDVILENCIKTFSKYTKKYQLILRNQFLRSSTLFKKAILQFKLQIKVLNLQQ
ncbi:unnamed protein product, partial (macronuclear) [Paramecium tetraurelia]